MADDENRIDFVVIGAQKAGTTALFDYLREDPHIFLPEEKEVHFFDDESQDWARPDYSAFHRKFEFGSGRLCGEVTPIYMYWPNALERIRAYRPDIKLICLLRDPVERAWSHWRMEHARGADAAPFGEAIRGGRQRLFQDEPWGHHRVYSYVERGFYAEQLAHAIQLFSAEQLLVLQNEALDSRPAETLARVNAFLGLPAPGARAPRRIHVGPEAGTLSDADRNYLAALYAADQARLAPLLA